MAWDNWGAPPPKKRYSKKERFPVPWRKVEIPRKKERRRPASPLDDHLDQAKVKKYRKNKKKRLPHDPPVVPGEISPCKPLSYIGFFRPKLAKQADEEEEPNPQGQITMTKPDAFLDFFKPLRWIRGCPAPRSVVHAPKPPPDPKLVPRVRKKRRKYKVRGYKVRRGWYCEQVGYKLRNTPVENFLCYSSEEKELVERIKERKRRKDEIKFEKMYRSYSRGAEYKKGHILRQMGDMIELVDEKHVKKLGILYEKWRMQVFEPIQRQIEDELNRMSPDYIKDKLRWYQYQYCSIANKQMILRDFPRPDYNPFEPLEHTIKYSLKDVVDPCKHDIRKENNEKRFMGIPVSETPVTRFTLGLEHYPAYHFRGTVWGHIEADEEDGSEIVIKQPEKYYSHDLLWNQKFVGHDYVKAEFPLGRYRHRNSGKNLRV
ncbi:hypothetical protein SELMODRAFT_422890 [Selaginella moellendorffii]|uniref:Uncharacterized protein n=1 Tax=Selaginella moellendorffii TaxID=88036 RepID=D8SJW1_SELML|nr:hypothetical protein SELMODRAFT_422890 [Selaginella moellendorffii]